jgi:hypothetical protein
LTVLEKDIEAHLVKHIATQGGLAYKFSSPARRSVPDRLVLLPGGEIYFVECKAPGKKPTPAQTREHEQLRTLGFNVRIIDSREAVNHL